MTWKGKLLVDGMVQHVYRIKDGLVRSMDIREASEDPGEGGEERGRA